ncbi:long-chain fatty acid--CoA ligase [Streptomyces formicae]|uniref:Acyl-CoA synthetase, AMP-(Fatty) acid ligase / (3R)-hydroxymyristoyl-[ACP] dehydratase n=1 Tax=Streptomyces formicae TaxID=1616117 RepID=A0A291Q378_9ACTN|nr:long-chain fatty acid--CoA ligase [Streptomyces formicae]ATL26062.1 Acyl-CoA synthetase, AMP-(fatty) acid ligase / (3R)-hydroxymyristoyl-[ACP] dehydratase [Streptomyces formicae]
MTATEARTAQALADGREEIPLDTSGSTGAARRWFRLPHQMEREVELIGTHLVGPVDRVVSYAPPHHLFGALFGQWLPRMARVPVQQAWADPYEPPSVSPGERVLVVCVPMAWELLRRAWPALERARSIVALHSSAAPPRAAQDLVRRAAPLLRAHEILGSTETGGIGHRPLTPGGRAADPWRAFPDVDFVRPADAPAGRAEDLVVRGPRLARPEHGTRPPDQWATGDLVEFTGPRAFRLIGRDSSLIKVNGIRVHLARVDERLNALLPQAECVAVPLPDDSIAGEGYAVFWSCPGKEVGVADIRAALRDFPSPSRVVELADVPRTSAGKPDRKALLAAL